VTSQSYFGIRQDPSAGFEPSCHLPPSCFMTALTCVHACLRNRRGLTIMPCMPSVVSRSGSHVESSWRTRSPRFLVTKDFSCSCLGLAAALVFPLALAFGCGLKVRVHSATFSRTNCYGSWIVGADIEGLR